MLNLLKGKKVRKWRKSIFFEYYNSKWEGQEGQEGCGLWKADSQNLNRRVGDLVYSRCYNLMLCIYYCDRHT